MAVPSVASALLADAASLRRLAQGLLGPDEAEDVVQDAWLAACSRPAALRRHPGLWLRGTVRKLALMVQRGGRRRLARERLAAKCEVDLGDPAAMAMQAELVRDIGAAVHALAEPFRTAILMRFWHDLPVAAIAQRLGVPDSTVYSRLQRGLARLREQLDQEHGNRERWAAPLGAVLPLRAPLATALCLMNKKLLLGACAVLLAALAIPWLLRDPNPAVDAAMPRDPTPVTGKVPVAADAGDTASKREVIATPQPEVATTGTLVVRVLHADEPKAGSDLTITVGEPDGDFRVGLLRAVTDAAGVVRFENVKPGKARVRCTAGGVGTRAEVRAGETTECVVQLLDATLTGVVVDQAGVGIAGALVETCGPGPGLDAEAATITAADGTFVVRGAGAFVLIGARANGYAASQLHSLIRGQGTATTVRIELIAAGGCVGGSVTTVDGKPVEDAVVRVGEGKRDSLRSTPMGAPALPAQVRTDAQGRFLAVGVPPGSCPVQVRAPGLAPWTGTCEVAAAVTTNLQVRLEDGVTCSGLVRTEAGAPVPDLIVRSGREGEFLQYFARSRADGTFTMNGLPTGETEVWAMTREHGKASARVNGAAGGTVRCELVLSFGAAVRGLVTDENGKPLGFVAVMCEAEGSGPRWRAFGTSDESGRFIVPDCPPGRRLLVKATASSGGLAPWQQQGVDPGAGELRVQILPLLPDTSPRARITGRVVGLDGQRCKGVEVRVSGPEGGRWRRLDPKSDDGSFIIEATTGTWEVRVHSEDHPTVSAGTRELQGGADWDLGMIQLPKGGTLVVHEGGHQGLQYTVLDAREKDVCGIYNPVTPRRSELLVPGEYLLVVRGKGIALHVVPFTIKEGEETALEVRPVAGVRQRVEYVAAPGVELPERITCNIRRDGKLVGWVTDEVVPRTGEMWLLPGDYVLAPRDGKLQGTAKFTVGREEGPPVRITFR